MSAVKTDGGAIGLFQKGLTAWVLLCMALGTLAGHALPALPKALGAMEIHGISMPIAVLIWAMITPMMIKVDFQSIRNAGAHPAGLVITWIANWAVKPFTMFAIAWFFLMDAFSGLIAPDLARGYLAGAVLLGAAPCTAMVFVWSSLARGNPAYTVVQVATNDLIILAAFAPIVKFLLGVSDVEVPYGMLFLSVALFVVVPLCAGVAARSVVARVRGREYLEQVFVHRFDGLTTAALLLTLVLIFSSQANTIISHGTDMALIAVPLALQTFLIFAIAYGACRLLRLPFDIAAPAGFIGASNFFELALAVAVALFGPSSPAALATTVGVLTEVPLMLALVRIANSTKKWFEYAKAN